MITLQAIAVTIGANQLLAIAGSLTTVVFSAAVTLWKLFARVHSIESQAKQEQRVNAKYFELFECELERVTLQVMETRDLTIGIAAKMEVANNFDRQFWERKFAAERREHKQRIKAANDEL